MMCTRMYITLYTMNHTMMRRNNEYKHGHMEVRKIGAVAQNTTAPIVFTGPSIS
jgi:hypothetical protein